MPFDGTAGNVYAGKRVIHLNIGQPDMKTLYTPEVVPHHTQELKSDTRTVVDIQSFMKDMQVIEKAYLRILEAWALGD